LEKAANGNNRTAPFDPKGGFSMGEGTGDKVEGKWDELKGKAKEKYGDAVDDESMQAEGKKDELKGKGKQTWGDVKNTVDRAKDRVKDAAD
jgi:uncharacterized protein YjbJ (UPF0337 family)